MTEPTAPTVETEDEVDIIFRHLEAERTGPQQPALAVHQKALLRKAAILMASDSATDARDLVALLEHAPAVVRPGAVPEKTLAEVCKADAPWDLARLSNEQVLQLENIQATAVGAACALPNERTEAA